MSALPPFSRLVVNTMKRRGLGLRELCRQVRIDPSFFSKVLAGKRNPPAEEEVLRRVATALETDAVELLVAAGRIPSEWSQLMTNRELLRRVDNMANFSLRPKTQLPSSSKPFNEELL